MRNYFRNGICVLLKSGELPFARLLANALLFGELLGSAFIGNWVTVTQFFRSPAAPRERFIGSARRGSGRRGWLIDDWLYQENLWAGPQVL
jgi:hypothetical protein